MSVGSTTSWPSMSPSLDMKEAWALYIGKGDSRSRASIFLVGAFLMNKSFLAPNLDVFTFGLSKHRAHGSRTVNTVLFWLILFWGLVRECLGEVSPECLLFHYSDRKKAGISTLESEVKTWIQEFIKILLTPPYKVQSLWHHVILLHILLIPWSWINANSVNYVMSWQVRGVLFWLQTDTRIVTPLPITSLQLLSWR